MAASVGQLLLARMTRKFWLLKLLVTREEQRFEFTLQ
jgi:hypothetical protein